MGQIRIVNRFVKYQNREKDKLIYGKLAYCIEEELEEIFTTYHNAHYFRDIRKRIGEVWNVEEREVLCWGIGCCTTPSD